MSSAAQSLKELRSAAVIDLAAVAHNVRTILATTSAALMVVVKADGYGHGAADVARAALAAGATMAGVATLDEAVALREAGIDAPIVCWLWGPHESPGPALAAGVEIVVSSTAHLAKLVEAVVTADTADPARIHLKGDTGLGRGGAVPADWADLTDAAAAAQTTGLVRVVGLMSHLASADEPGDVEVSAQLAVFEAMTQTARAAGLHPEYRHLANSPGTLAHPATHLDLVRCGIAVYGLDPLADGTDRGLRPVMTLRTRVALTKRVPAGHGVSYGLTYRTAGPSTLALVPLGYADGVPRSAGDAAQVQINGRRYPIAGRVAMDQFVIDVGDDPVAVGDEVVLFGPGVDGEPTAREWALACGTIDYEIVTRIGARVPRVITDDRDGAR